MQDLYLWSTDPSLETVARSCRSCGSHPVPWSTPYISSLKKLDHQVKIDDLSVRRVNSIVVFSLSLVRVYGLLLRPCNGGQKTSRPSVDHEAPLTPLEPPKSVRILIPSSSPKIGFPNVKALTVFGTWRGSCGACRLISVCTCFWDKRAQVYLLLVIAHFFNLVAAVLL